MKSIIEKMKRIMETQKQMKQREAFSIRYFRERERWKAHPDNRWRTLDSFEDELKIGKDQQKNIKQLRTNEKTLEKIAENLNVPYEEMIKVDWDIRKAVFKERIKDSKFRTYCYSILGLFVFSIIFMVQPTAIAAIFTFISGMLMLHSDCGFWAFERAGGKDTKSLSYVLERVGKFATKAMIVFMIAVFLSSLVLVPDALV